MDSNQPLSEYQAAGLSEYQIDLLHKPFQDMQKGEAAIALAARDKLDEYREKNAQSA